MDALLNDLGDNIVYLVIGACFLTGMLTKSFTTIVTNNAREKSRREIAAYVAEGSISPEQGEASSAPTSAAGSARSADGPDRRSGTIAPA